MSVTQTVRRPVVNQTRTHDYLYDPLYTLSSERDHARQAFKSHTSADRIKRVPVYNTMFSALNHFPRFAMRLESTDPVPRFINRQWRGYGEQARQALIRYKTFNYAPGLSIPKQNFEDAQVGGRNRYKYFRRPLIPFLQQWLQPDVVLQTSNIDPLSQQDAVITQRAPTPPFRTVEIQTDYRESETQTDPYTPEYVVRPGSQPELLTLATLSYGHGLPAGLAEVEMIERARAKREWEATLPPLSDVSQLEKRKRMMDEMERKEWALREQEIEKLQEARLKLLQKILREREEHHSEITSKRLDKVWSKKQKEKEKKVAWIRKEHIKAIRKLTEKRRTVEGKLERRDITNDYSSFESEAYAPLTRHGVFMDKGSEQYAVKSKYLSTYRGLLELENSLPDFVLQPRVVAPKPKAVSKDGFVKRAQRKQNELDEVYRDIKATKNKAKEKEKPLRLLQKIEKPIPRPPTPSVEVPDQVEEEKELAIIFLQQVIRGRAIQNMMYEGKEKRQELINELRSTHALQEAEQEMLKQEKQATLNLQRQRKLHHHKEAFVDEALSKLEGSSFGDALDFLSKELIRLQEERRIHAFAMLAERKRRIREAEESGRRQVEERRRREEDEIFKQVVKVHQSTVDTYLEDMILMSMDMTADDQARREVQVLAEQINDIAYELEDKKTELESEEIVAELVSSFLLPEVQKQTVREKIKQSQRKHLLAAHKVIHKESEQVITDHPQPLNPAKSNVTYTSEQNNNSVEVESHRPASGRKTSKPSTPTKGASPVTSRPPSGSGSRKGSPLPGQVRKGSPKVHSRPSSRPGSGKVGSRPGSGKSGKMSDQMEDKDSVTGNNMETVSSDLEKEEPSEHVDISKDEDLVEKTKESGEDIKTDQDAIIEESSEIKSKPELKGEQIEDKVIVFDVNKETKDNDNKDNLVSESIVSVKESEELEGDQEEGKDKKEEGVEDESQGEGLPEGGEDVGQEMLKVDSATQDESSREPERKESATQEG